jgi:phosphate transport system substrate-binding protein
LTTFSMRGRVSIAVIGAIALAASACGADDTGGDGTGLSGTITVDGSSTVAPLTSAAAELFMAEQSGVQITVGTSGTGGGFKKFCAGEVDMADASRSIKDDDPGEGEACRRNGISYEEVQVANDGIAVVVNKANTWARCLTVEQLEKIWGPDSQRDVTNWRHVDPSFPDEPLKLFGAGTASGTFDFFTKAVNGEEKASRSDYNATEDDNVTVQGVAGDKGALGYFGLSYYEENQDKLAVVAVDGGAGCVEPSQATVQDGTYTPLSRPLFVYPSDKLLARPAGAAFVRYFVENSADIARQSLFVPMTDEQFAAAKAKVESLAAGGSPTTAAPTTAAPTTAG